MNYECTATKKEFGNKFFIPTNTYDYFKEIGVPHNENRKLLTEMINIHIKDSYEIYRKRCKEHAKRTNAKKHRWEIIQGKIKKENTPPTPYPNDNEIIDLTEKKIDIIIDLTIEKKKRKRTDKIIRQKRKRTQTKIIVCGLLPKRKRPKEEDDVNCDVVKKRKKEHIEETHPP